MIKLIQTAPEDVIVPMSKMKPCEVGQIIEKGAYEGKYVMRSFSTDFVEIMNLSNPCPDGCWTYQDGQVCGYNVRLLRKGEKLKIELFND